MGAWLSGVALPLVLLVAGFLFGGRLGFFWFRHPVRTLRLLGESAGEGGTSPFAALTVALAGTLGVGNIVGVATAITAGGAGAVFWMVLGALVAMPVKYAEVALAVRFRRQRREGNKTTYYGGAMYYIRDGLTECFPSPLGRRTATFLGGVFALLCIGNALLTGNVVQVHAAASSVDIPPLLFGGVFALAVLLTAGGGMRRFSRITVLLIPLLACLYILLCLVLLFLYRAEIPAVLSWIFREAFGFSAVGGGVLGLSVRRAVRFGITRGIFSNEAGCGTAPTAHASADAKSPHHQGCLGLFEVFADTVVLCSLTALVLLLYGEEGGADGMALSLRAFTGLFGVFGGPGVSLAVGVFLRVSVVLFAYATVVCQNCYGVEAVRYFLPGKWARRAYTALSVGAIFLGALISPGPLWQAADWFVSLMTVLNVVCLFFLSRFIPKPK